LDFELPEKAIILLGSTRLETDDFLIFKISDSSLTPNNN